MELAVAYWLLQCNPAVYDFEAGLRSSRVDSWSVKRFLDEPQLGDEVVIWSTGSARKRGVTAVGRVTGRTYQASGVTDGHWANPQDAAKRHHWLPIEITTLLPRPVLAIDLRTDPRFSGATILREYQSGNPFRLTANEWSAIMDRAPVSRGSRDDVARLVGAIRGAAAAGEIPSTPEADEEEIETEEGRRLYRRHRVRERNPRIVKQRKAQAKAVGALRCEVCGFDFAEKYPGRGDDFIEAHHVLPLAEAGVRTVRPSDLALVCSNCHSMLHQRPWCTPEQLRAALGGGRRNQVPTPSDDGILNGPS